MEKNRIMLDEHDEEEQISDVFPDKKNKKFTFLVLTGILLLLIFIILGGIYFYRNQKQNQKGKIQIPEGNLTLKEKYYYPEKNISSKLKIGIQYYREGRWKKAEKHFHSVIDFSENPLEKAIAYTYLGILSLEWEKFPLAKHYFLRALQYQDFYLPALVNLAIAEYHIGNWEDAYQYAKKAKEIAPDDALVSVLTGNILMNIKGAKEAEKEFRRSTQIEPQEPIGRYNLAVSLLRQGKAQEALLEFQHFLELFPNHELVPVVLSQIAQIYYGYEQYERALSYYKRASGLSPDNAKIYYNMGVIYFKLKDKVQAQKYFKKAMESGKADPEVFESLSRVFEEFQDSDKAIRVMERALQYYPDHIDILFRLGELYYKNKDFLKSAEIYRKIVNRTAGTRTTEKALLQLGKIYIEMERYADAVLVLKKALELEANPDIHIYDYLGVAYSLGGRKDKAVEIWKYALNRSYINPEEEAQIRIRLANLYQNLGSFELAVKELKKIEISSKNKSRVYYQLGKLYQSLKDYKNAISYYLKIFNSVDSTIEERKKSAIRIAECFLDTKESHNLEVAKSWIQKALRMDPNNPEIIIMKARILIEASDLNDLENAIEILLPLTYEELAPSLQKDVYYYLGIAYFKNQEYSRSLRAFQMVLQMDPEYKQAIDYKNRIIAKMGE